MVPVRKDFQARLVGSRLLLTLRLCVSAVKSLLPKNAHHSQMREINHLRRKTWEKVRKDGLEVGKAAPFSDLATAFSHFNTLFSPVFDVFAR